MKRDKYSCKTDANQAEIVKALRDYGCSVTPIHMVGGGCPDILAGKSGVNVLIEVKVIGKKLNEKEQGWFDSWQGQASIANTAESAIEIVRSLCK